MFILYMYVCLLRHVVNKDEYIIYNIGIPSSIADVKCGVKTADSEAKTTQLLPDDDRHFDLSHRVCR